MSVTHGYYSLIQYMPDACTQEVATIGVLVLGVDYGGTHMISWDWNPAFPKAKLYFDLSMGHFMALTSAMEALNSRLTRIQPDLETDWDIDNFAKTLCNSLRMTPCRSVAIAEPETAVDVAVRMTRELTVPRGFDPEGPKMLH